MKFVCFSSTFPSILKLADIIPVYQKDSRYEKSNYHRPTKSI